MDSEVNSGGSEVSNGANGASEVSEVSADSCQQGSATVEVDAMETARPSRVDAILQSKTFRDELERLVSSGLLEEGQSVTGCLEQLTTMISMARGGARSQQSAKAGYHCVQPVYDLRGAEASHFSAHERTMRCRLACLFRMVDALGWSDDSCSHFVVLLEDSDNNSSSNHPHCSVLVNPTDLLYSQLSASTLLSVPLDQLLPAAAAAQEQQQQHTRGSCAAAAVDSRQLQLLHGPLLAAGSRCVLHVRHLAVAAVSALRCGLLPLTEYACALGPVEHLSGFEQLAEWYRHHQQHQQQQEEEGEEGAGGSPDAAPRSSSSSCGVVLVRHHGAVCVAESPEQAFFLLVNLVAACETQLKMMPLGVDNLVLMSQTDQKRCYEEWHTVLTPTSPPATGAPTGADSCLWRAQFDTGLRLLERTGCRTGHMVQLPLLSAAAAAKAAGGGSGDGCDLTTAADLSHALASPNRKMSAVSRTGERNRWLGQQQQQQQQVTESKV